MGCSVSRRTSRASAGGHEEQPSEVNNSTRTGLRVDRVAGSCGTRGESTAAFRGVTAERATSTAATGHLIVDSSFMEPTTSRIRSAEVPSGIVRAKEGYNKAQSCPSDSDMQKQPARSAP